VIKVTHTVTFVSADLPQPLKQLFSRSSRTVATSDFQFIDTVLCCFSDPIPSFSASCDTRVHRVVILRPPAVASHTSSVSVVDSDIHYPPDSKARYALSLLLSQAPCHLSAIAPPRHIQPFRSSFVELAMDISEEVYSTRPGIRSRSLVTCANAGHHRACRWSRCFALRSPVTGSQTQNCSLPSFVTSPSAGLLYCSASSSNNVSVCEKTVPLCCRPRAVTVTCRPVAESAKSTDIPFSVAA
jgi:hypothetical protein